MGCWHARRFVFFLKTVGPKALHTWTTIDIIFANHQGDRQTTQASSAYTAPQSWSDFRQLGFGSLCDKKIKNKKNAAAVENGRNLVSKHQIQPECGEFSRLKRDGTAEPVSRDQILRRERGQGNIHFPCPADHEQDWQPYPVDSYSVLCDVITIHGRVGSLRCMRSYKTFEPPLL